MSEFNHREIEKKWQQVWEENQTYKVEIDHSKPKYYVLDMFPYPSGAGLHVGHPLGYIATDIYSRYKRLKGFNVLHPMGFDSFGLPAEQYAIQTGQHPAITTENNITTYISQLKKIGFCYDWSREVRTSDAKYYKWTQWIFMELFRSWYNKESDKAEPIETLYAKFEQNGTFDVKTVADDDVLSFTAEEWKGYSETEKYKISLKYRLTFLSDAVVNFCPALGMVLSNDEVKDGVSERGGYPVIQKKMQQWMMRITAYADRLISGLDLVDWSDSLKEQQKNWIGRSVGAMVKFALESNTDSKIEVFTTRVDTIYGVSFMVLAPEHELVASLTTPVQKENIENYIAETQKRSELDRVSDVRTVSGAFTGSYCVNPFSGEQVPIWIADYVLAGYGTGAVMGVPSGDQRDWNFATHFGLPIVQILDSQTDITTQADSTKEGNYVNSGMIDGLGYKEATTKLIAFMEENNIGKAKVNYRLRDAVFARQRYWGEPVPVFFSPPTPDGGGNLPYLIDEKDLPLVLPEVDKYLPTEDGEPPLGRADNWHYSSPNGGGGGLELSTMPGWAGSSWYWFRYMDAHNDQEFASKEAIDYWQNVDLYLGGTEHATGHLLYSRFWNKFLKDRGYVPQEEYAMKLINQGMIMGVSQLAYRLKLETTEKTDDDLFNIPGYAHEFYVDNRYKQVYYSADLIDYIKENYPNLEFSIIHIPIEYTDNNILDEDSLRYFRGRYENIAFVTRGGINALLKENENYFLETAHIHEPRSFKTVSLTEKMSKSKYNVVNPDTIVEKYGADTFRLYEMFLGPLTESKPWDTRGIEGTYRFIRKLWRLFYDQNGKYLVTDAEPTKEELKALHKTIKKVSEDIEDFSFNTSVSSFMICVNELSDLKCHKKVILEKLVVILSPYAPHVTEELWQILGNSDSITVQEFPIFDAKHLIEDSFEYPIQINGKVRVTLNFPADMTKEEIEKLVMENDLVLKWLEGATPKKVIVVPKRIVNVVI